MIDSTEMKRPVPSGLDFSKIFNCRRSPTIPDLHLSNASDTDVLRISSCCRNGTILSVSIDPKQLASAEATGRVLQADDFLVTSFVTYHVTANEFVTECTDKPFDTNELNGMDDELSTFWSNIKCPSNNGHTAWRNAWQTHGVCSGLTQKYFRVALHAHRVANVLKRLHDKDIVLGNNLCNLIDVKVELTIECSKSPYGIEGLFQIYQVFLCFCGNWAIVECPLTFNFKCSSYVQFMPFDHSMLKSTSYC